MRKYNLLVIDANETICALLSAVLNGSQRSVSYALTGQQALEALRKRRFDICFLDLRLPDAPCFELLHQIRALSPETRIFMVAGNRPDEEAMRTIRRHAVLLLIKPFDLIRLEDIIREIMENNIHAYQEYEALVARLIGEKRRYGRQPFTGAETYSLYQYHTGVEGFDLRSRADAVDISEGGLGIRTRVRLESGRLVRLSSSNETFCGIVRWSAGGEDAESCRAGIQFVKCNE